MDAPVGDWNIPIWVPFACLGAGANGRLAAIFESGCVHLRGLVRD